MALIHELTAVNVVGPDGWRERMVPDWTLDGEGSDYYEFGPNATDDFFAFDPQGSVAERLRVDEGPYSLPPNSWAGEFVPYLYDEAAYDAYGNRLLDQTPDYLGDGGTTTPATILPTDAAGYEAQFGYQTDPTTGLLLAGHRYYQPQTRRWLNRDPTGYAGGDNLYEYADDDPVNEADPSGDMPWWLSKAGWQAYINRALLGSNSLGNQPALGDNNDPSGGALTHEEMVEGGLSKLQTDPHQSVAAANAQARATVGGFLGSIVPVPGGGAEDVAAERTLLTDLELLAQANAKNTNEVAQRIFSNPEILKGKSLQEVRDMFGQIAGQWEEGTLGKGSRAGQGWTLRERLPNGEFSDKYLQYHPGGGHHGPDPYWKVSSGLLGTVHIPSASQ